jgi:Ca2+:H+ antiporter
MRSHHSIYKEVFEKKPKLTTTEAIIAVAISLTCVSFMAIYLVDEIDYVVEKRHIKDA